MAVFIVFKYQEIKKITQTVIIIMNCVSLQAPKGIFTFVPTLSPDSHPQGYAGHSSLNLH